MRSTRSLDQLSSPASAIGSGCVPRPEDVRACTRNSDCTLHVQYVFYFSPNVLSVPARTTLLDARRSSVLRALFLTGRKLRQEVPSANAGQRGSSPHEVMITDNAFKDVAETAT